MAAHDPPTDPAADPSTAPSNDSTQTPPAPAWFGAAANSIAFFPVMMGAFALFYAAWWPFAWGVLGTVAFAVVLAASVMFVVRGIAQIRHASRFPVEPTAEGERLDKAMNVLNSATHLTWMAGSVLLLVVGLGRWVLPLMVFVIGAHFLPMARLFNRWIDYLLGPASMIAALVAGVLALDPHVSWVVVFAVASVGGAISTVGYALYMAWGYQKMCREAGVASPFWRGRPCGSTVARRPSAPCAPSA